MQWRMRTWLEAELSIHFHEVKLVPRFGNLAVLDTHDGDAGKLHRIVRGRKAELIAGVLAAHVATRNSPIAFRDYVFHVDVHVGKRPAKLPVKLAKRFSSTHRIPRRINEAVNHNIVSHQLID